MNIFQTVSLLLAINFIICGFAFIGLGLFLARGKLIEIDRVVLGHEIPRSSDNIFYKGIRLMNYAGAFAWRLGASRSRLLYLRDKFDVKFQQPFKIYFWLIIISVCSLSGGILLDTYTIT